MELKELYSPGFAAVKRVISFVMAMALLLTLLPGGVLAPIKAYAAGYNINSGSIIIAANSGDHTITGTGVETSNTIQVRSGYNGTITLSNVNIKTTSDPPMEVMGVYSGNNAVPVTKVNIVLDGDNKLFTSHKDYAALQVNQGAQISISSIDPNDNSRGSLWAETTGAAGSGIGAPNIQQGTAAGYYTETGSYVASSLTKTTGGNIIIGSGTVTAYSGLHPTHPDATDKSYGGHGAAIGGAHSNGGFFAGNIIIYGGVVTAQARGTHGAGIGSGCPNGSGNNGAYIPDSSIVAMPPAEISAITGQNGKAGLGGAAEVFYMGDPQSPILVIQTQHKEKNAKIYADFSEQPLIASKFGLVPIENSIDITRVLLGETANTAGTINALSVNPGEYKIRATLATAATFYTDATSTYTGQEGKPFKPVKRTVTAAATIELPLLNLPLTITPIPSVDLQEGYTEAQAKSNAVGLKVEYSSSATDILQNLSFAVNSGSAGDFKDLEYYQADGVSPLLPIPTQLNPGDALVLRLPLKNGKPLDLYSDTVIMKFDDDSTGTLVPLSLNRPVDQRVTILDTNYKHIQVTAEPSTFVDKNENGKTVDLKLKIDHTGLSVPYNRDDVIAEYLVSTQKNLADIPEADRDWKNLSIPTSNGVTRTTIHTFSKTTKAADYYIHWQVISGLVSAASKDFPVNGTAPAYGAFGPYTTQGPELIISNGGINPVTGDFIAYFEFDKKEVTGLDINDLVVTGGTVVSTQFMIAGMGDGFSKYRVTIAPPLTGTGQITIAAKKNADGTYTAAQDVAGNKVTDTVTPLVVNYSRNYAFTLEGNDSFTAYDYGSSSPQAVNVTIKNTGDQELAFMDAAPVTLTGTDADKFMVAQPSGSVAVGGSETFTLSVNNPGTLPAGDYTVTVQVKADNGTSEGLVQSKTITLTVNKAKPTAGQGGTLGSNPVTNTASTPYNNTAVTLTPDARANNSIVSWKYRIYKQGETSPGVWKTVTGNVAANDNFPCTADGIYEIEWEMVNSNYADTSGKITPFHIDLICPQIVSEQAPSAVGAGQFGVELTFDKEIANLGSCNKTWLDTLQNCTIVSAARKSASDNKTIVVTVQPDSGLNNSDIVGFTVKADQAVDIAGNKNDAYVFTVPYNAEDPYIGSYIPSAPAFFIDNIYNTQPTGSFIFEAVSNGQTDNKALYAASTQMLSTSNVGDFVEVKRDSVLLSAGPDYTVTYTAKTSGGAIKVEPPTGGFVEGEYTITIKAGLLNAEGNAMKTPYNQGFEVRVPSVSPLNTFVVTPANHPDYTGGAVAVKLEGQNLQYAAAGQIKFEVQNPGSNFTTLATNGSSGSLISVNVGGTEATFATSVPMNSTDTAKTYTYKAFLNGTQAGSNANSVVPAAAPGFTEADHGITANPTNFATYVGGSVVLTVKGMNLHNYSDLRIVVTEGGTPVDIISIPVGDLEAHGISEVIKNHAVSNNMTNTAKTYTYTLFAGTIDLSQTENKAKATVTIAPATPAITKFEGTIGGTTGVNLETDEMGGTLSLNLEGVHLHNFAPLTVSAPADAAPSSQTMSPTHNNTKATCTFTLPENTTQQDKTYDFEITKGGQTHTVTVVVRSAATDLDSNGYGLSASPTSFDFQGGTATLTVKGRNLYHYTDLKVKVEKDGVPQGDISLTTAAHGEVTLTKPLVCARNDSAAAMVYTLSLWDGTNDLGKTATVTVEPSTPHISGFTVSDSASTPGGESLTLPDGGGTVHFTVSGLHLHNYAGMFISGTPAAGSILLSGLASNNNKGTATVTLPANRTLADITYTYNLENADGVSRQVTIKVEKPEVGPTAVTATPPRLGASGGSSDIRVTGSNMEIASLELKAKDGSGTVHTIPTPGTKVSSGQVTLPFPAHSGGLRNDIYEFEVYFDGLATGLTTEVEIGDSVPNLTGIDATPAYFDSVQETLGGNGRSRITIKGNYLFNFSELSLYDPIYNRFYTVPNAGRDMEAGYTVSVPSAIGVYEYTLYCEGVETGYVAIIKVGEAPPVKPEDGDEVEEKPNPDKYWSRRGGGSKGGGFTGRFYVPFDVLRYQSQVAATKDPNNASVALQNIGYLTSHHFDLVWSGGKKGALESKELGEGVVTLKLDTTAHENTQVLEGRIFIQVDRPLPFIYPGVYLHEVETGETAKLFREKFTNRNQTVICLDQDGEYGTTVEVAAAVDLKGFNTSKLYLYLYNRETGEVTPMKDTEHFIDTENFLHFKTAEGGDVIVTDQPLEMNGKKLESDSFPFDNKKVKAEVQDSEGGKEE
ncbi:hypothetical protein U6B65_06185 [Oscillospiraceae bacterium MB08-C2-2]|nr:hypothetical protein U6B65_06185 [Oscillospiraceae bacterium MB08-C2-2]